MLVDLGAVFLEDLEITWTTSIEGSGVAGECWSCRIPGRFFRCPSLNSYGQIPVPPSSSDPLRSPLNPLEPVDADS